MGVKVWVLGGGGGNITCRKDSQDYTKELL